MAGTSVKVEETWEVPRAGSRPGRSLGAHPRYRPIRGTGLPPRPLRHRQAKIVLGAPDFLTYGVFMGKGKNSSGSPTAMECQAIQAQLSAWLDDELDAAAGAVLTAHLNGCEACRREWRELTALDAALSNLA